jgi:hypothetical protein
MSAWLEAVSTFFAALAAFVSVLVAWRVWKGQEALGNKTNQINDIANSIHKTLSEKTLHLEREGNNLRQQIADKELLLTQRAQLVPLWQYWSLIDHIRIDRPAQIIRTVNTLELVVLCWEADIIDRTIIQRTFRETFMQIIENWKIVLR